MIRVCDVPGAKSRFEGLRFPYWPKDGNGIAIEPVAAWKSFLAYDLVTVGISMTHRNQPRRRSISASICLLVVVLLYAPLAGAAWSSYQASCCTSDQCPIAGHHHQKTAASPANQMDCGHDMPGMMACSMSCCHDSERSIVSAVAFVLPSPVVVVAPAGSKSPIEATKPMDFLRSLEPLSPPPRLAPAAA